jgi:hypothetical protein
MVESAQLATARFFRCSVPRLRILASDEAQIAYDSGLKVRRSVSIRLPELRDEKRNS